MRCIWTNLHDYVHSIFDLSFLAWASSPILFNISTISSTDPGTLSSRTLSSSSCLLDPMKSTGHVIGGSGLIVEFVASRGPEPFVLGQPNTTGPEGDNLNAQFSPLRLAQMLQTGVSLVRSPLKQA